MADVRTGAATGAIPPKKGFNVSHTLPLSPDSSSSAYGGSIASGKR